MAAVEFTNVRKSFGGTVALEDFSMTIEAGELVCLLGPSGCGKTTALRILAGFEVPDSGAVQVDGQDLAGVRVERRNFGMVFQDYSLFPNMTARQNIAYGMRARRVPRPQWMPVVDRMLEMTDLGPHAHKFPHQLSGGQKQRVALARALATSPRVLLLDEPLSALDAKVREALRDEIRRLQRDLGITTIFVTHDQHEALAICDRVAVMSNGRVEQVSTPRELYQVPANAFVADFIGSMNRVPAAPAPAGRWSVLGSIVDGLSIDGEPGDPSVALIRPEQLVIRSEPQASAAVTSMWFLGPITRVAVADPSLGSLTVDMLSDAAGGIALGDRVSIAIRDEVGPLLILGTTALTSRDR